MESDNQISGIITGEFALKRRKPTYQLPDDAPPDRIRREVRAEVENRLRDVCGNWPTGEFDRIVAEVTATALKYYGRERRRKNRTPTESTVVAHVPGGEAAVGFLIEAAHSVQRFLQLEILPPPR